MRGGCAGSSRAWMRRARSNSCSSRSRSFSSSRARSRPSAIWLNWRAVSHRSSSPSMGMRCSNLPAPNACAPSRSARMPRVMLPPMPRTIFMSVEASGINMIATPSSAINGTMLRKFSRTFANSPVSVAANEARAVSAKFSTCQWLAVVLETAHHRLPRGAELVGDETHRVTAGCDRDRRVAVRASRGAEPASGPVQALGEVTAARERDRVAVHAEPVIVGKRVAQRVESAPERVERWRLIHDRAHQHAAAHERRQRAVERLRDRHQCHQPHVRAGSRAAAPSQRRPLSCTTPCAGSVSGRDCPT